MDSTLIQAIAELGVVRFGASHKNKDDSPSCLFDPRLLLSRPDILEYAGGRIAEIALREATGSALVGMATSGIAWASVASISSSCFQDGAPAAIETPAPTKNASRPVPAAAGIVTIVSGLIVYRCFQRRNRESAAGRSGPV